MGAVLKGVNKTTAKMLIFSFDNLNMSTVLYNSGIIVRSNPQRHQIKQERTNNDQVFRTVPDNVCSLKKLEGDPYISIRKMYVYQYRVEAAPGSCFGVYLHGFLRVRSNFPGLVRSGQVGSPDPTTREKNVRS